MKEFNFKYYPARMLIGMILTFTVSIALAKQLIQHGLEFNWMSFIWPLSLISLLALLFTLINKFLMWSWYLKLLGLTDVRGKYKGQLISSFHVDDDPSKPNITMDLEMTIAQNLNGLSVSVNVYPKGTKNKTSQTVAAPAHLSQLDDGRFLLEYRYSNEVNKSHPWDKKYNLTSTMGWAHLIYNPDDKTLEGFYTSYENQSRGTMKCTFEKSL